MDRDQLDGLAAILRRLLRLPDAQFTAVLNGDPSTLKGFIASIAVFCANWGHLSDPGDFELVAQLNSCHMLLLRFLLRLCPSFNSRQEVEKERRRAVIAPKKLVDALFDVDPLGLLLYIYATWRGVAPELAALIRDELVPRPMAEKLKRVTSANNRPLSDFVAWTTNSRIAPGALSGREREDILRRYEFESDDDLVDEGTTSAAETRKPDMDPVQAALLAAYTASPAVFSRTSAVRNGADRKELMRQTSLSHEQIEGWAVMLERNPKKTRILQDFVLFKPLYNK